MIRKTGNSCSSFWSEKLPPREFTKQAMFSALEQMAQFYPWDPKHADLPPGFPQVAPGLARHQTRPYPAHRGSSPAGARGPESGATFRIMGPSFSGSAVSLRFVLDKWSESRSNYSPTCNFKSFPGPPPPSTPVGFRKLPRVIRPFRPPCRPTVKRSMPSLAILTGLGYQKIAILTEGNTAYGQNFTKQSTPGKVTDGRNRGGCGNGQSSPGDPELALPHAHLALAGRRQQGAASRAGRVRNR